MNQNKYNLRTYAIIRNGSNEVLVADELRFGRAFTKFPGGGLEWGEGLADGLKRELKEELNLDAEIGNLFYVNEFFQVSAFKDSDQLISFYFEVSKIDVKAIPITNHDYPLTEEGEKFRWISLDSISAEMFTFPIDKVVAEKLKNLV